MLFDVQLIQPLFKLETGIPGSSFAFEIAKKIGIPEDILNDAKARLGDKQSDMEKNLREIVRDKKYWENKKDHIRKTNRKLDELSEQYEKELLEIKDTRKKLIREAKEEAKKILASVNREIENTVRTIRESQADKETTKEARNRLEDMKKTVFDTEFVDAKIEHEIQKIQKRRETRAGRQNRQDDTREPKTQAAAGRLSAGDRVRIKGRQDVGEVMSVGQNTVAVAVGNIIITSAPDRVEKISPNEYAKHSGELKSSPLSSGLLMKRLNFKSVLDVRGERSIDALEQVVSFIDEAIMLGVSEVRILHGKGSGILKDEIRTYLKTFGNILTFADEDEEAGGAGITVVKFKELRVES
jgi:DNA mismatch repair protein MutS2